MPANFATIHSSIFGKTVYKYLKTFSLCPKPTPPMSSNTTPETQTLKLQDGTFKGAVCDGVPHGFGVFEYDSGATYKGNVNMGKKHGHGTYTFADGQRYEGEWQDDRMHGSGTLTFQNGIQYTGNFKIGKKHGHGKETTADGKRYEGEWQDNHMHGSGTMTLTNGYQYSGNVHMDKRSGYGIEITANGTRYEGEWQDDLEHGSGKVTHENGDQYSGNFMIGKKHGHGKETTADGNVYVGEFENGIRHGKGKMRYASGQVVDGMFEDGHCYKERASCLKLELEALQLEVARQSGKEIEGLSMEQLKEIQSKNEQNMRRMQHVIEEREARTEVALLDQYNCPLTLDLMEDPVFASDGYTYERTAIEKVIQVAKAQHRLPKSPKTNLPLEHTNLLPNHDLKSRICSAVDRVMAGKRQRDDGQGAVGAGAGKALRPS